jgi:hypothetical protein
MLALSARICVLFLLILKASGQLFLTGCRGKVGLALYKPDRTTLIGPLKNNMVIDLAKTPTVNIKASAKCLKNLGVSSVSFFLDGKLLRTENSAPYWMFDDKDGGWTPTVGNHTVTTKAYSRDNGKGRKILETTTSIIVMDSRTKSPVAAPVNAPFRGTVVAPMMVPIVAPPFTPVTPTAPVTAQAPAEAPVMAPTLTQATVPAPALALAPAVAPTPVSASTPASAPMQAITKPPTRLPTEALSKAPTKPPTGSPTEAPSKAPTKPPTRLPSNAPSQAPIKNCDLSTVAYINCITQSNRTLTMNGTTAEDKALQWLVNTDPLQLLPTSEANKTRLRQRFALLTFGFQPTSNGQVEYQRLNWNLAMVDECAWSGFSCESEQVTFIKSYGYISITGTLPPDLCWLTAMKSVSISDSGIRGTLPTQLGWWTNLTKFDVGRASITGTIPSSIGAWTGIQYMYLSSNKLTGTIPSSIGAWTGIQYMYLGSNKLTGTIPSLIGAWTGIQFMDVADNQLNGTVPSEVVAWTTLLGAFFQNNNLDGTMPAFGNSFCPKLGQKGNLLADCLSEISCACCNYCL